MRSIEINCNFNTNQIFTQRLLSKCLIYIVIGTLVKPPEGIMHINKKIDIVKVMILVLKYQTIQINQKGKEYLGYNETLIYGEITNLVNELIKYSSK